MRTINPRRISAGYDRRAFSESTSSLRHLLGRHKKEPQAEYALGVLVVASTRAYLARRRGVGGWGAARSGPMLATYVRALPMQLGSRVSVTRCGKTRHVVSFRKHKCACAAASDDHWCVFLAAQHPAHAARFSQCIHAPAAGKNKNLFQFTTCPRMQQIYFTGHWRGRCGGRKNPLSSTFVDGAEL